ncbi:MAG: hypothetical protein IT432_03490 [Phycisphaerales bacterium]|nr:hypothetical protein [Phycisphaerales bacterium]
MESTTPTSRPRHAYHNLMLTLLVAGVGVLIFDRAPSDGRVLGVSTALAQPPEEEIVDPTGRVNPADQRKQIIAELKSLNTKVSQLEATLKRGIKITEMPQQKDSGVAPTKAN